MQNQLNKRIGKFIFAKIMKITILLFSVCLISFVLVKVSPIDPVQAYIGSDMLKVSPEQREIIAKYWGLDQPIMVQFINWLSSLLTGDLGTSLIYRYPVIDVIGERFLYSAVLLLIAWVFSGLLGFAMGVISAMKKDTWVDKIITWYCYTIASTPTFWIGLLLIMTFAVWLGWFPIGLGVPAGVLAEDVTTMDKFQHLFLPALTLSIVGVSNMALHTREKLIDVLDTHYCLFARAKGEEGFILFWRHGLRNIAIPAITLQFTSFSGLFGGAVLVEQIFSYPGLGQALVESGLKGDIPLLLGLVIFSSIFVFVGNLLADFTYFLLDPRIREDGTS